MSVALSASNYSLLTWVDGVCQGNCTNGAVIQEVYAYGNTPIGQSLVRAKEYFTGAMSGYTSPTATDAYAGCRPVATIILTDGDETCGVAPPRSRSLRSSPCLRRPAFDHRHQTYAIGFGLTAPYANIENMRPPAARTRPAPTKASTRRTKRTSPRR